MCRVLVEKPVGKGLLGKPRRRWENIELRRMGLPGCVASVGESRNMCRVLVEKPVGKGLLGKPRRRWENIIKMDL